MVEYVPFDPTCCGSTVTPKRAILTLALILSHDFRNDHGKQGFWIDYTEDELEDTCPLCKAPLHGGIVIEASCLHRFHYDCLMHKVAVHDMRFCPDMECRMRIY